MKPMKVQLLVITLATLMAVFLLFLTAEAADLPVTSPFGWRYHPIDGQYKFHTGVDLGYDYGDDVPALFAGQVVAAGDYGDGYGSQIMLYHPESDTYTRYCHLSAIYVSSGDWVEQGYIIGSVGSSGYSTGPHLHLEYIVRGISGNYEFTDPLQLWN